MPDTVEVLDERDWKRLRDVRLAALLDSPHAFLSNHEREKDYLEKKWRDEFRRGKWIVTMEEGETIALLGITRGPHTPQSECYFEYLWVSSKFRRRGCASELIKAVMRRLANSGVVTVWLWVLEGNDAARRLYEGLAFEYTGTKQQLRDDPARHEELMKATL